MLSILIVCFFLRSSLIVKAEERTTCLKYDDIVTSSMSKFDMKLYEGIWYVASTNEPTEPTFCKCDQFNWTITSSTRFIDADQTTCAGHTSTLNLVGNLSIDPNRIGMLTEGMPPLFPEIDNFVLYVEYDMNSIPNATIRYSCKENYIIGIPPFRYKLFESVQIWAKDEIISEFDLDRLFQKSLDMGIIQEPSSMKNFTSIYADCSEKS